MSRTATVSRTTGETDITITLDLDGAGVTSVSTGIGFLDHLLTALGHHGLFDLTVAATGDLEIDEHHTAEDTMLVLGSAFAEALGDRAGITRYGDAVLPMDEALATAAVDVGGRPYAVTTIEFHSERIGALGTQMIPHMIEALARTSGFTIHLSTTGRNDPHSAEAAFKALARALRAAVADDPRRTGIPSTKGAT